ncbi:short-chain dehydrogenase, partial [Mesorhizobium sp. M1E.F.Ca.ET.041.01.1.1]
MPTRSATPTQSDTGQAVRKQRDVQRKVDAKDRVRSNGKSKSSRAMQA